MFLDSASSAAAARDKADGFNLCLSEYAARESKVIQGELVDYCECLKAVEDRRQTTLETITVSMGLRGQGVFIKIFSKSNF